MIQNENMSSQTLLLSQEELAYLVSLSGVSTIPGIGQDPFEKLTPEQYQIVATVVQRSLIARGLLLPSPEGLRLNSFVADIIQICIRPGCIVAVATTFKRRNHVRIYSFAPGITICHTLPSSGIHQLTITTEAIELLNDITAMLPVLPDSISSDSFSMTGEILTQMLKEAGKISVDELKTLLCDFGATGNVADKFAEDIVAATELLSIQVSSLVKQPATTEIALCVQGSQAVWLISPSSYQTRRYDVQPADQTTLNDTLERILLPVKEVKKPHPESHTN